jgi:2-oxoglutarate ferredoxin oxidoreductase subunit alpha
MSVAETQTSPGQATTDRIVNDFSIIAATVNGSGSQTANNVIVRSIFKMGIPVTGKNLFPSNIKGLPTWFLIRVSKDNYTARQERGSILIAMNLNTAAEDVENVEPGGIVFHPDDWRITFSREDLTYYPLPVKDLVKQADVPVRLRDYIANMVYVGAVAELLGIPIEYIKDSISYYLGGKEKAIKLNLGIVEAAEEYVRENLTKQDPFVVEPMDVTDGLVMIDGNTAGALGAVFGGVSVIAWYPITPSTSVIDAARDYLALLRRDEETGKATYAVVQAEDELAAIGMVLGAGWAGARSMTATSGPGISLMAEYAGLGYAAELPGVIWDIQRAGPSTGLPTRTSQGDLMFVYFLGHGDTRHVVLLPGTMKECFEFGWRSLDISEQLQTPVFVLSDLDLGMNQWMSEPFDYPDEPIQRGKVLDAEGLDKVKTFARYEDVDGDGVGYRTLPGTNHPQAAYFTRGTGHNKYAIYSERPEDYVENTARLQRKHDTARGMVPKPIIEGNSQSDVGVIVYGSVEPAVLEARDILQREHGFGFGYMRVRALPFTPEVFEFVSRYKKLYIIENNLEGQLSQLLHLEIPDRATDLISIAYMDGLPFTGAFVADRLAEKEGL